MALSALSLVAMGLATAAAVDRRRTADAMEGLQADALVRSAVATASVLLAEQAHLGEPDTLHAPWAQRFGRQAVGPGWVEVAVEDETRRLDLNAPGSAAALPRLLRRLGLDPALADAVADWTDARRRGRRRARRRRGAAPARGGAGRVPPPESTSRAAQRPAGEHLGARAGARRGARDDRAPAPVRQRRGRGAHQPQHRLARGP